MRLIPKHWVIDFLDNGKTEVEKEITIHGLCEDFSWTDEAFDKEEMFQYEVRRRPKPGLFVTHRVRSINRKVFKLAFKNYIDGKEGALETEMIITKDAFEAFAMGADNGMHKIRHFLKGEGGRVWEIDVYLTPDGKFYPWVKLDLEYTGHKPTVAPPIPLVEMVGTDRRDILDKIYDDIDLTKY